MAVDQVAARKWINSPPSRFRRFQYLMLRLGHHAMPRLLDGPLSLWAMVALGLKLLSSIGILTSPFWIGLFLEDRLPTAVAGYAALALVGLRFIGWLAPKVRALGADHADDRRNLDSIATRHFNTIRELFGAMPPDCLPDDEQWRLRLSDKVSSCVLHVAQHHIGVEGASSLQCTFMAFDGDDAKKLRILSRARDTRLQSIEVPADQTISHYVAESGRYFVVNDLKSQSIFPYRGLSQTKASYRSIMLIPVVVDSTNGKACVGVVTLDSPRPCEFWGDIGDSLATQLIPFVHILTFVMNNRTPMVPVKEA